MLLFFEGVSRMLRNGVNLDADKAWFVVIDRETQEELIRLNTEDQLGNSGEGIDALGISLGEYSPLTKQIRSNPSDPRNTIGESLQTDHVSFEFTGGYLDSWTAEVTSDAILLSVDSGRYNELVNDLRFSKDHVGVTDKNLGFVIRDFILPNYHKYVWKQLRS